MSVWRQAVLGWPATGKNAEPDSELTPTARLVAQALALYMDANHLGDARPGPALLVQHTGLSMSSVKAQLKALVAAGWIEQVRQGGTRTGGTLEASVYRGCYPAWHPRARGGPGQEMHGVSEGPHVGDGRAPVQDVTRTRTGDGHHLDQNLDQDLGPAVVADESGRIPDDQRHEAKATLQRIRSKQGWLEKEAS